MRRSRHALVAGICLAMALVVVSCGGATGSPTPFPSLGANEVVFTARDTQYTSTNVHVPANTPWTLALDNQDNLPHNVVIIDSNNNSVFVSTTFTGPGLKTDAAPALAAGTYRFMCAVHPAMTGTITVP